MSNFLTPSPVSGLATIKPALLLLHTQTQHNKKQNQRRNLRCPAEINDDGSISNNEATSSSSSSSPTPWPASSWPRPSGSSSSTPVCRECRGRGVISSAVGPLPCPACISWRRKPDSKPGKLLVKDINLNPLEQQQSVLSSSSLTSGSSSSSSSLTSSTTGKEEPTTSGSLEDPNPISSASSGDEGGAFSSDSNSSSGNTLGNLKKQKDRRGQNMTEQKRLAIKTAMQGRGPLDSDHKRRISNAMRERYSSDPSLRQAGKPKKCSHCGQLGHNRKKCPELVGINLGTTSAGEEESEGEEGEIDSESSSNATQGDEKILVKIDGILGKINSTAPGVKTCSVCGEAGHNKRSCPQLLGQRQAAAAVAAAKFIIIEERSTDSEEEENNRNDAVENLKEKKEEENPTSEISSESSRQNLSTPPQLPQEKQKQRPLLPAYPSSPPPLPPGSPSTQLPQQKPKIIQNLRALPGSNLSLAGDGSLVFPLPSSPEQCVAQAAGAILRAWSDGIRRQTLELLLPQAGSDTAEGWPGGIRQQFRAALPMVESLLLRLKRAEGLEGRITAEWVDEGDCVGAWQSERLAAVVFPTADSLAEVRRIDDALSGNRLMVVVNPQWQPQGQVVSDFGFGKNRRAAERYVASLDEVFYLRRIRVLGDEVRVLRCYPSRWQVHYVRAAGDTELISVEEEKPTYLRLLEILKGVRDSRASKSWLDRALDRGWYDDIAAYNEGSPQAKEQAEKDDIEGDNESVEQGEAGSSSLKKEESGVVVVRDIVTGEIISRDGNGKNGF